MRGFLLPSSQNPCSLIEKGEQMRIVKALLLILIGLAIALRFGPRDSISWEQIEIADISLDTLDNYLRSEQDIEGIKVGQEKQVIWANGANQKTAISIVYIHGFSASLGEIRPVPDDVAKALGANIFYTRLTGHGLPGDAMGETRVNDWIKDFEEAIKVGEAIGDDVILMSASTGGTLIAANVDHDDLMQNVKGIIFVSPNFKVKNWQAELGKLAFFDKWGPMIAGETRSWEPANALHGEFWTTSYPTKSIVPMMALIDEVEGVDFSNAKIPALFYYSENDQVVDASVTDKVVEKWGGTTIVVHPNLSPNDDPYAHVIAGDALSPDQNDAATKAMIAFIKGL